MKILLAVLVLTLLNSCGQDQRPPSTGATPPTSSSVPAPDESCVPAPYRLCPGDEAISDSSLVAVRREMMEAVERKDAAKLLAVIDPQIRTSFGDDGGIEAFQEMWNPDADSSRVWRELGEILKNGGRFRGEGDDRSFWAPSIYAAWPESLDAYQHVAAVRSGVPLRNEPADSAAEVTRVDWEILELILDVPRDPASSWVHVRTKEGKIGWVRDSDVRSPIDYRAGFNQKGGQWKLSALVGGD